MIEYACYSDKGGRAVNEDAIAFVSIDSGFCALVADGLGGQGNGDVASQTAVQIISNAFQQRKSALPDSVRKYFFQANDEVIKINHGKQNTMSTAVGLFVSSSDICYAHVGDSRLYHFFNGRIAERTLDHSVPQVAVMLGEISEGQIRNHPDRNRVLRAIGSDREIKTETHVINLTSGFHAFLLCTDGFWEYVFEDEMEVELARAQTPNAWLEQMKRRRAARAPSDADNNSAITLFLDGEG